MYDLFFISTIKSINPYFTRPLKGSLTSTEIVYITYILKFFLLLFLLIILLIYDFEKHHKHIKDIYHKCTTLNMLNIGFIITYCVFGMLITLVTINLSFTNNPSILFIITKVLPSIIMVAVGIFIIKEDFNYLKLIGLILAIIGLYLMFDGKTD
jgi:drug/metabolite transporter (DMT)-like permease